MKFNLNDTIAAISTPIGESGIGIVRISGARAISIADMIFVSKDGRKPSSFKTYTTHYGWIVDSSQGEKIKDSGKEVDYKNRDLIVDEVILTVMRKPRSYTKEDIVEINCHGGIVPLRKTLELVLGAGARLAQPGEFTQRAFLNGRIDLTQAEAVLDIIRARTDAALNLSLKQLKGNLSRQLDLLRNKLLAVLSALEASIDFPDQDLKVVDIKKIAEDVDKLIRKLDLLLAGSERGRIFREGIKTVICGRPNVGKSSLLNALLKCERAIVTAVPGTTRDTIEEILDIRGIPLRIVDTAGIIEPRDLIERKAVSRTQRYIEEADLILLVFDGSRTLSCEDEVLLRRIKPLQVIALINKIDLRQKIEFEKIAKRFKRVIHISAKKQKNINLLEETIAHFVFNGKIKSDQPLWVTNIRHIQQLKRTQKALLSARRSINMNLSLEFIAQGLKEAVVHLDELQGKRFCEEILDMIFSKFCIGK